MVLLRFAPSPTGSLHLGGLRTALYNYLYAKKLGGKWILRIEDTDATRAVPGAVDEIRSALDWAGLDYDYGPGKNGPHAPYYQSERLDLYRSYASRLIESGHAYRCFCTPDRLLDTREKLARTGSNKTYDKTCLHLTEEEVARRVRAGEKSIVRLNDSNLPARTTAPDLVFGTLKDAHASLPTDPILLKTDLFPTYHLANVVDDHEMGITHVLRGEEWLLSLPLHLDLYASLSLKPPQFAHLPLLLNRDGSKMSKRKGDVRVLDYKSKGWEPGALLNWLALAGWGLQTETSNPSPSTSRFSEKAPDSTTMMSLSEMIRDFDLTSITHRRSVLDPEKLRYLNQHHLMQEISTSDGLEKSAERSHDTVKVAFPLSQYTTVPYIKEIIRGLEGRVMNLYDIPALAPYFFERPDLGSMEANSLLKNIPEKHYLAALDGVLVGLQALDIWDSQTLHDLLFAKIDSLGITQKAFMFSLRYALTGMKSGPSIADIMRILGRERTIERIQAAKDLANPEHVEQA